MRHLRIGKVATLFSYLRRPMFYGTLLEIIRAKLLKKLGLAKDTRGEAMQWCASLAVDTETAIRLLIGEPAQENLDALFPEAFGYATHVAASCAAPMGGSANLPLLFGLCESVSAERVIETGVAYGWSSMTILLSLQKRDGRLISTDMPYPGLNNDLYVGCVVPENLRSMWQIIRSPDRQALPKALVEMPTFDLCHYDSDKSYRGRLWAYGILWKALRRGGAFISDDVGDNLAFRDFCLSIGVEPTVVEYEKKYCGVLIKR